MANKRTLGFYISLILFFSCFNLKAQEYKRYYSCVSYKGKSPLKIKTIITYNYQNTPNILIENLLGKNIFKIASKQEFKEYKEVIGLNNKNQYFKIIIYNNAKKGCIIDNGKEYSQYHNL